jgi:parvulin-like peptidyl-prolyl isomerase
MNALRTILIAAAMCGFSVALHSQSVNGIQAVVHDSVITFHEVDAMTAQVADVLSRQLRSQPEAFQKRLADARSENLDQLIERQLILHDFKTAGYNLPDSLIDEIVQQRIRRDFGDRATLTKSLQAQGITYEKFRQRVKDQFIIEQMRFKNVSSEVIMSPHKIERYYNEHKANYQLEDQIKLRMIVLNKPSEGEAEEARQRAEEILSKIKEGATFSEMASVYSQGSQRKEGGDWGWVERSVLRKELADVAFNLKPGELSEVIDTPSALYLMQVEETKLAHVKPLNEVREEIEQVLQTQERARLEKQYVGRLKKKTFFRYF